MFSAGRFPVLSDHLDIRYDQAVSGCDSIVNLNPGTGPQVVSITGYPVQWRVLHCRKQFHSKTGSYIDTLNSIFYRLRQYRQLTCSSWKLMHRPLCKASGLCRAHGGDQWDRIPVHVVDPSFLWTAGPGGQVVGGQGTLFALVNEPAPITLRISKQLERQGLHGLGPGYRAGESAEADLKGPAVVSYCEGSTVNLTQLGFADQNNLGGSIAYYDTFPFIPIHQIGPVVDPTTLDTVYVWYQAGGCLDTLAMTWKEVPKPQATILPAINICNNDAGGVFNTLINF